MMNAEYLIVGSGLTGATIARSLADVGKKVLVVERRAETGGNVVDYFHESGIRMNRFGPHYFRTGSKRIWDFVHRFSKFYSYEATLFTEVNGKLFHWPAVREELKQILDEEWTPNSIENPKNFEEASLNMMSPRCFDLFVKEYSEKQWGQECSSLSPELAGRFDVRSGQDFRLKSHRYQGIPELGYSHFIAEMLKGIPVVINCDFREFRDVFRASKKTVYTGSIDGFFDYQFGRLAYRAQRRVHEYLPHSKFYQSAAQINNPLHANGPHIRTLEWKHMLKPEVADRIEGTVITREVPREPQSVDDYEYPIPDSANKTLHQKYRSLSESVPDVVFCGRLGEYRYWDMDQAIGRALGIAERLLETDKSG